MAPGGDGPRLTGLTARPVWYRLPFVKKMHLHGVEGRLRDFESQCRAAGLPMTVQRRAIFEAVVEREDHPTAEQIYESVRGRIPGVSRTTVYRVLDTLTESGMIRRAQHVGASARFDGKTHRHHHLLCTLCKRVIDFDDPSLDSLEIPRAVPRTFRVSDYSVQFMGTCAACRSASASGTERAGAGGTRQRRSIHPRKNGGAK